MGAAAVTGATIVRSFTIENTGVSNLVLNSNPVSITGAHPTDFTITQPALTTIPAGGNTTFTVTFDPSAAGLRTATVSIANNSAKNPYTFVVGGTGILPSAQLNGVSCDLIDAITAANSNAASGSCPAGSSIVTDTITLLTDVELDAVNNSGSAGTNGLPQIVSSITIEGGGHTIRRATTAPAFRFFLVVSNGVLTLNNLTLQNGQATFGVGLENSGGAVRVHNSTFTGNVASYFFDGAI